MTQLERNFEIATDHGVDIHGVSVDKKHQIIYPTFLGYAKIVRIGKHK